MRIVTAAEMRKLDRYAIRQAGIPGLVLMENAGRSVVAEIFRRHDDLVGKRVSVFCGPGNNGGDGFVIARYLHLNGVEVDLFLLGGKQPKTKDALKNLQILQASDLKPIALTSEKKLTPHLMSSWTLAVDAIFGTGLERSLTGLFAGVVRQLNRLSVPVYAVDIPSGLHTDTGEALGEVVQATATITFGYKKRGFFLQAGPQATGEVCLADISLDDAWADEVGLSDLFEISPHAIQAMFPPRPPDAHKGTNGHVLVVGGSAERSGAAVLASRAALRAGAGLVTAAVPASAHTIIKKQLVEGMTELLPDDGAGHLGPDALADLLRIAETKDILVVGPGLKHHPKLKELLAALLKKTKQPVVLDADGLNAFGVSLQKLGAPLKRTVLTPHPGEMGRLWGKPTSEIQARRLEVAQNYAQKTKATVVLKGAYSVVAWPTGETFINPTGNPGMATAGMGDVLSGMLGAYLAQGLPLGQAANAAVFHHGLAGDQVAQAKGPRGLLAGDLIEVLPGLFRG